MKTTVNPAPPPPPVVDPNLAAEQAQAQQVQLTAMQGEAQSDTAAMMARYGTRLALSNVAAPTVSSPVGKV